MMNRRRLLSRVNAFALATMFIAVPHCARAQQTLPEGTLGWWYYTTGTSPDGYAADPVTACKKTAQNHMGTPLIAMRPHSNSSSILDCKYKHFLRAGGEQWFGMTIFNCKPGYFSRAPGMCVKRDEAPPPS
ncbi:MAG: hypothetical protein QFF03_14620, partial [Pseudomonadota bacterium]|nr:hypothetical protein [Pseudomonadota bacterium]